MAEQTEHIQPGANNPGREVVNRGMTQQEAAKWLEITQAAVSASTRRKDPAADRGVASTWKDRTCAMPSRRCSPRWPARSASRAGAGPFFIATVTVIVLLVLAPQLVLFLPNAIFGR
mgnify:CR=1 FL=1